MTDETETEGVVEEQVEAVPVAVAVEEAPQASEADEPVAVAVDADVPAAEAEPVDDDIALEASEPVAEAIVEVEPIEAGRSEAQLYLCERGHRTLILWGEAPATCNARKTRNEVCGLTLYHSTELPEQVQKALNPIKASKKKSGKK